MHDALTAGWSLRAVLADGGHARMLQQATLRINLMLPIETELEEDGRWIAEVAALPGVQAYGATEAEARSRAAALAFRVIADRIEHGEPVPDEALRCLP
jgi:predicted RNase H-like HicB family nuclease